MSNYLLKSDGKPGVYGGAKCQDSPLPGMVQNSWTPIAVLLNITLVYVFATLAQEEHGIGQQWLSWLTQCGLPLNLELCVESLKPGDAGKAYHKPGTHVFCESYGNRDEGSGSTG